MNHGLDTDSQVFFYEQDFYVLSNFSAFNLQWKGITFSTSEHAYHCEKFGNAHHPDQFQIQSLRDSIVNASSAHMAFQLGQRWKSYRRSDWDDIKIEVMLDILRKKVAQHEYVCRKLLATGHRQLIENSWRDDFWGWGENHDGQNMLGKLWMKVRDELRGGK